MGKPYLNLIENFSISLFILFYCFLLYAVISKYHGFARFQLTLFWNLKEKETITRVQSKGKCWVGRLKLFIASHQNVDPAMFNGEVGLIRASPCSLQRQRRIRGVPFFCSRRWRRRRVVGWWRRRSVTGWGWWRRSVAGWWRWCSKLLPWSNPRRWA